MMNKGRNLNPSEFDGFRNFCWYDSRGKYVGDNVNSEGNTFNSWEEEFP
jgi:hypothetical protein